MSSVEFTPSKRGRILQLRDEGYTYEKIHQKIGCSTTAAWETVHRDKIHHTRNSLPRSGRPRHLDDRQHRRIVRELRKDRRAPFKEIGNRVGGISEWQVRVVAAESGYHRRVARRKPFLKPSMVKRRIQWAKENSGRDWTRIVFTDEANIELGERPGRIWVTRKAGEEFLRENIQPTFRSGRDKIMVWACIAHNRKGPLIRLDMVPEIVNEKGKKKGGGLDGPKYVKQVLQGPLKDFVAEMKVERGPNILVLEDGAPSHRSKVAAKARSELGLEQIKHPPDSPDLNPIEPLWNVLKNRVADIPGSRNSLDKLWAACQQVWDAITVDEINAHTGKMDDRVAAVKAAKGFHTRF
jgi:transposase